MTAVKICGMRRPADLECCRQADYLGFVVLTDSPRNLELETAKGLMSCCGNLRVAVTTERRPRELERIARYLEPDVLQLHSPLDPGLLERVKGLEVPVWGMLPVRPGVGIELGTLKGIKALVLDSPGKRAGGSGAVHDWTLSRRIREMVSPTSVVLAGGLRPENVLRAVAEVRPFAVDVSSGVEGNDRKDPFKVQELIRKVKGADGS